MKVITWNMNGGSATAEEKWNQTIHSFFEGNPSEMMVALQSCDGVPESAILEQSNVHGINGLSLYKYPYKPRLPLYILYYPKGKSGVPCNLAFVTPFAAPISNTEIVLYSSQNPEIKPVLGIRYQQVTAFTIEASSQGEEVPEAIKSVLNATTEYSDWFLIGTFNRSPESLKSNDYLVCDAVASYPANDPQKVNNYLIKGKGGEGS